MKPRYEPQYDATQYPNDKFVGYIEEFDLYITPHDDDDPSEPARFPLTLVGKERGPVDDREYNFDTYMIERGIIMPHSDNLTTLNVTPYHMCLLYAAAIEHGLIKEQEDGIS
jgi:hypothetical protein